MMRCRFVDDTGCILSNWALDRLALRRRKWLLPPFVCKILPVLVTRNRFAAALYVLSLYLAIIFFPHTVFAEPGQ